MKRENLLGVVYYMLKNESTLRSVESELGYARSTLHNAIHTQLPQLNNILYEQIVELLNKNSKEKYVRGGLAMQKKLREEKELLAIPEPF